MAQRQVSSFAFWALVIGCSVSAVAALYLTNEQRKLAAAYREAKASIVQLEQARAQLSDELTEVRTTAQTQAEELTSLEGQLKTLQGSLAKSEQEITRLQQANLGLNDQLAAVAEEKHALEAKLSSLKELKLAIRAVKQKIHREQWEAWLAHVRSLQAVDQQRLASGNHGYVVQKGLSTLGAAPSSANKLQVRVLEPQSE